jgi:hypothetical protein
MGSEEEKNTMEEARRKEQLEKKQLVLDAIAAQCNDSSEFEDLKSIGEALKAGDKLGCKIISGGKTNFSYKVFLEGAPEKDLFAKLSFSYALWRNPDRSVNYDLQRAVNEFDMMNKCSELMGGTGVAPVVTPYLCLDMPDDAKLNIYQWSPADEQWANQFIDGT